MVAAHRYDMSEQFPELIEIDVGDVIVHVMPQSVRLERPDEPGVFDTFTMAEPVAAVGIDEDKTSLALEVARQMLGVARKAPVIAREAKRAAMPDANPEDDDALCKDAANRWRKQHGQDRIERAVLAVAYVLDNNDYEHEYTIGRDRAVKVVKRGLARIGKAAEWPERKYPVKRKAKSPPVR
jgi:hypothetical protein